MRIPPIHEWEESDLPHLKRILDRTETLVCQPVRDHYRGLLGTAELARLTDAKLVIYPVLRFDALFPFVAIIRSPKDPSLNPPVIPYHDLRIFARAAGLKGHKAPLGDAYRKNFRLTLGELSKREAAHGAVPMSDWLEAERPLWHTINHPNNATLEELGRRVATAIGGAPDSLGELTAPEDREMLGHLEAPVELRAAAALGVNMQGRHTWTENGNPVPNFVQEHLAFYQDHPEVIEAGLRRHAEKLEILGLHR